MRSASLAALLTLAWAGGAAAAPATAPGTAGAERDLPAAAAKAPAAPEPVVVNNVAFAVDVSSLNPVGVSDSFDASVKRVYFWNRLSVSDPPAKIKHVWHRDGKNVAEFILTVRYNHSRIWTYKNVKPGSWKVEITDEKGEPITVAAFVVRKPSGP